MAQYSGMQLTNHGLRLQLQATINSVPLHFTRVMLGDGTQPDGMELKNVNEMVAQKLELPITGTKVTGDGTGTISCLVSNEKILDPFHVREIGIYAQDGEGEVLYSYAYAGQNCDYMPAGGGPNVVNYILTVYVVIDRVTQVTANVDVNLAFATTEELQNHVLNKSLHVVLGEDITQDEVAHFWVEKNDNKLHRANISLAQKAILGGAASTLPVMESRINQLERETANISLALIAQEIFPDYNMMIAEDFAVPDKIDTFICNVLSAVAGDDSIDIESLSGIVPGAWYTISDGVNQEYIQVRSCIKNGSIFRIIANKNLEHTYLINQTMILRSTAQLAAGVVYGSGNKKGFLWQPSMVWKGVNSNVATTIPLETTQDKADLFEIDGDIEFTTTGYFTLTIE